MRVDITYPHKPQYYGPLGVCIYCGDDGRDSGGLTKEHAVPFALYQSSEWVTDDGPVATCDGHDFPGLIDEGVPGIATVIDDVVEGFEDPVRQPVLSDELPDIFLAVELRCTRWQL